MKPLQVSIDTHNSEGVKHKSTCKYATNITCHKQVQAVVMNSDVTISNQWNKEHYMQYVRYFFP